MGTRSLTVMYEAPFNPGEEPKEIVVMYRQFDGYPDGHGEELASFLKTFRAVTNGMSGDTKNTANGGACLAAQIIAHFKTDPGNFYLYPAGTRDAGEEYIYEVFPEFASGFGDKFKAKPIRLKASAGYGNEFSVIFDGPVSDWDVEKVKAVEAAQNEE